MNPPQESRAMSFWMLYAIVMAVDLILYVLIFYAGKAMPPASPYTSFPGNYGLMLAWIDAHRPAALIFFAKPSLPVGLMWILILQDVWVAGLICWLKKWKSSASPRSATPLPNTADDN